MGGKAVSKNVIVAVCDSLFIEQTKYLFGALRKYGKWQGDLVLLANDICDQTKRDFQNHGVIVHDISATCYWAKVFIFDTFMKQWEKVIYFDQDFYIHKDVNSLFDQIQDKVIVDKECCKIGEQFQLDKDNEQADFLKSKVDLMDESFNASCIIFPSAIIQDDTMQQLETLRVNLHNINWLNGNNDVDQPALNVYFYKQWQQIKNVCFNGVKNNDTIASHLTHYHVDNLYRGAKSLHTQCVDFFMGNI